MMYWTGIKKYRKLVRCYHDQDGICIFCQRKTVLREFECQDKVTNLTATIEHILPTSKGGNNKIENLCMSCSRCNYIRGNQYFDVFMAKVRALDGLPEEVRIRKIRGCFAPGKKTLTREQREAREKNSQARRLVWLEKTGGLGWQNLKYSSSESSRSKNTPTQIG